MHRGKVADAILPQIVHEQEVDIMIISEQYTQKTTGQWFEDDSRTAAIWIPDLKTMKPRNAGKGNGFVWVQIVDITLISCYLTPSDSIDEFQSKLNALEDEARNIDGKIIMAGDFNSRAVEWGSQTTNPRGRRVMEMTARLGLAVANVGNVPTFRRPGCIGTIPDITLVSENLADRIENWKVLEIYTASDHQYISFSVNPVRITTARKIREGTRKWNIKKLNRSVLKSEIDRQSETLTLEGSATEVVTRTMDIIIKGCNKAMPKLRSMGPKKKPVYWWNGQIDELRRNCLKRRRKFTRAKRRGSANIEHAQYKDAKKALQIAIQDSKKNKWEELRDDINRDPFGLGYKIVMKKLGAQTPTKEMSDETMGNIVSTLFPTHEIRTDPVDELITTPIPFTTEELQMAAKKLKNNKAPGPDGVPTEVLKDIADARPDILVNMYNHCLIEGTFPTPWKEQQLVLISKGKGDPAAPSSYRPLCMLNTAGKLFERLLKPRIEDAIRLKGGLSKRQHGFRPGKSTIGAIKDVVDVFSAAQQRNSYSKPVVLLATLDVKNAFNSLRWTDVLNALERNFQVPIYLMKIIRSYLRNRVLMYNTSEGTRKIQITSGAAQGSILGPDLWNISYDEILKIDMPENTFLVGYADDIAAVIQARNTEDAQRRLRQVMIRTKTWLESRGLQLAMHKTELVLLTRQHIPTEIDMQVNELIIRTKRAVTYLGIRLDTKLFFSSQINYATEKATKITAQLSRLMSNIGGPLPKKRKLLMEACNSILLYGCEIWARSLCTKQRAHKLLAVQRTAALRVTSAYRTVSASAVQVIAGMIPIDLVAEERLKLFEAKRNQNETTMEEIKDETFEKWQSRWNQETYGRWTAKLIPNIRIWVNRKHGDVNYYITQMISGHGYFRKYLYKRGKCSSPFCLYEEEENLDDAEHTLFSCRKWVEPRLTVERQIGAITAENLVEKMTTNEKNWIVISKYCEQILRTKKRDLDNA